MAWLAVDMTGVETIYECKPRRDVVIWKPKTKHFVELPKGSIKKLIGKDLTWEDEPVKYI